MITVPYLGTFGIFEIILLTLGFFAFLSFVSDYGKGKLSKISPYLALIAIVLTFSYQLININVTETYANFVYDYYSKFFSFVFLAVAFLVVLSSMNSLKVERAGLYYGLLLISLTGMIIVSASLDLILLVLAWELASMSTYAMTAIKKEDPYAMEAAMKYFVIGAVSSGITVFGLSLIYGATGSLNINEIRVALNNLPIDMLSLAILGTIMLISGLGFKMAIVPFHAWIPDTYEGAPTSVTTYLAAASKKMGFAAAFRIFFIALLPLIQYWSVLFAILAVITMTFGNLVALVQTRLKRMMAYSSIGHAGYLLIALSVLTINSIAGALMHVLMHALMTIAAFTAVIVATNIVGSDEIKKFSALRHNAPIVSFALSIALLSGAGIPLLGGFYSKAILFWGAVEGGMAVLAVIAVINSAISLYYYAKVIRAIYIEEAPSELPSVKEDKLSVFILIVTLVLIVFFGVYPDPLVNFAIKAASTIIH